MILCWLLYWIFMKQHTYLSSKMGVIENMKNNGEHKKRGNIIILTVLSSFTSAIDFYT